jgi:trehalose 6-phosphate synthase/phosphatase
VDITIKTGLIEKYRKAANKLILLDYDGTLVNYSLIPDKAIPSEHLLNVLLKLAGKPKTKVIIISGRAHQEIDKLLGSLPLSIIAEHGALVKENGVWKKQQIENGNWKDAITPLLDKITLKCPGSYIEEKQFSLAWHYRNAESTSGYANSRELINLAEESAPLYDLKTLDGNMVVEIMTREIGKGKAVLKLLEQASYDFILSIGDDATDEEIFELFISDDRFYTIKVGNGNTSAKFKFDSVSDVVLFLKHLSE